MELPCQRFNFQTNESMRRPRYTSQTRLICRLDQPTLPKPPCWAFFCFDETSSAEPSFAPNRAVHVVVSQDPCGCDNVACRLSLYGSNLKVHTYNYHDEKIVVHNRVQDTEISFPQCVSFYVVQHGQRWWKSSCMSDTHSGACCPWIDLTEC